MARMASSGAPVRRLSTFEKACGAQQCFIFSGGPLAALRNNQHVQRLHMAGYVIGFKELLGDQQTSPIRKRRVDFVEQAIAVIFFLGPIVKNALARL